MLGIPSKRLADPFKNHPCYLFHLFYQVQIRLRTSDISKNRGRDPTIPISAVIGYAHGDTS
jgi:hypothetical protein